MNFYIADLHFGHGNILRYDNRPFRTVDEMDNTLIENWNEAVSKDDTVYILGDISWYKEDKTIEIIKKLNGHKKLVLGNHDRCSSQLRSVFDAIDKRMEFYDNDTFVVLDHHPSMFWNHQFHKSVHLYGHVHNSHQWNMMESWLLEARQLQALPMEAINVGCMMPWMDYTPKTLEEIRKQYQVWLGN